MNLWASIIGVTLLVVWLYRFAYRRGWDARQHLAGADYTRGLNHGYDMAFSRNRFKSDRPWLPVKSGFSVLTGRQAPVSGSVTQHMSADMHQWNRHK